MRIRLQWITAIASRTNQKYDSKQKQNKGILRHTRSQRVWLQQFLKEILQPNSKYDRGKIRTEETVLSK